MKRTHAGFTLLEMLVAIAIFASLALMAQQETNGVTRVNSAVGEHDQKLNLMQQTMSFLNHDLTQMIPRPVRGDQTPARQRPPVTLVHAGPDRLLPDAASFVSDRGSENSSFAA